MERLSLLERAPLPVAERQIPAARYLEHVTTFWKIVHLILAVGRGGFARCASPTANERDRETAMMLNAASRMEK
ncbi:MAG: hypothetical protein DMF97_02750 [Acidobacteria bacterium]|nr:MAG: hypothetical protein DMF97_02750 [Acidobacteriota bacterium]